jgi:hypothetical protein
MRLHWIRQVGQEYDCDILARKFPCFPRPSGDRNLYTAGPLNEINNTTTTATFFLAKLSWLLIFPPRDKDYESIQGTTDQSIFTAEN